MYNNFDAIEAISPVCFSPGDEKVTFREYTANYRIEGHTPEFAEITPFRLTEGRFINDMDMQGKRKVAVIGKRVAEELFQEKSPINEYIKIGGGFYQVIGIFKSAHKGRRAEWQEKRIYTPISTMQKVYNYKNDVAHIVLTAKSDVPVSSIEDKIISFLKQRRSVHPDDNEAFWHWNMEQEYKKMTGLFLAINTLIWIVGLGTLISGIVGVSNIMLIVITERTKEIGIKRAIGARPADIVRQVLSESVVLTFISGYVGLFFGVAILEGVRKIISKPGVDTGFFPTPRLTFIPPPLP
ncbi:MAG: ABC transporter permease [Bacteroidales bacterium]|nr:ABC transporter permease [Bacteroidales bacterium]